MIKTRCFAILLLSCLAVPLLARAQSVSVTYVDNEFVALNFISSSTADIVTHLDRIAPTFATLATRSGFGGQTLRDTGLTPGTTYSYRLRFVNTQNGQTFTNNPVVSGVAGEVQGTLDQSMTWEGTRRLRSEVIVPTNVTLTVAEGAVVELRTNFSGITGLVVLGRMEARGARFHNQTNAFDGFGFRIASGRNSSPPFGSMLLSNCVFRQAYLVAFHGLEFGGNTSDLTNDQSELEWQEVPPDYVLAGENWPGLELNLSTLGAFTASNSVLHSLRLEPDSSSSAALAVSDLTFRRRGDAAGSFEVDSLNGGTLLARRLTADTNDFFRFEARNGFGTATNGPALQFLDCTRVNTLVLRNVTNALIARCQTVPNAANGENGIVIINSQAVQVQNNLLRGINTGSFSRGVDVVGSRDCLVFGNDIRGFGRAISLGDGSTGNLVTSNVCLLNGGSVIFNQNSGGPPTNNLLANNLFANGGALLLSFTPTFPFSNAWSFPTNPGPNIKGGPLLGGNFWGTSFFGSDTNGDRLSDTAFTLRTNNVDAFPLMPNTNLIVNVADDRPDADPNDNEADVDLATPDLQTTLRAALSTALSRPGDKRILFDLGSATPQMPPFVITITNGLLPDVRSNTVVDARTQPNRVLLDGTNRPNANGLNLTAGFNELHGLWFRNWGAAGVSLGVFSLSNRIQSCRFGIDPAEPPATNANLGTHALIVQGVGHLIGGLALEDGNEFGNARQFGVQLFGSTPVTNQFHRVLNNRVGFTLRDGAALPQPNRGGGVELRSGQFIRIGEPAAGNFIAGNAGRGIYVNNGFGGFARDNFIQANDIGFIAEALAADPFRLTNSSHGLEIDSGVTNTIIGATQAEAETAGDTLSESANHIAFNGGAGVRMLSSTARENSWRHNLIHDHRNLGLDVGGTGVTANNNSDGFQNFPVFDTTASLVGQQVAGSLTSGAGDYRLEFYGSAAPDPTFFGEGAVYLGSLPLTIPPGATSNNFVFPLAPDFFGYISAVATDAVGNSSEFSRVFGPLLVNLETDEADPNLADGLPDVDLATPGLQTTLRCALQNADLDPGRDTIRFVVPRVRLTANLAVVHPVVVDGDFNGAPVVVTCAMTQPIVFAGVETELRKLSFFQEGGPALAARTVVQLLGAHRAKVQGCTFFDCDLRVTGSSTVELGGASAGQGNQFTFREHNGSVRLEGALTTGAKVFGNEFLVLFPNTPTLELVDAPGNFIGGPVATPGTGAGNTFGTSGAACILLRGAGCRDNRVLGNRFGLAEGGDNAGVGVSVRDGAHDNLIGGPAPAERNEFEFMNLAVAVGDTGGERNTILGNLYSACSGAIDLGSDGPTLNAIPAAATGPNRRQNFPNFTQKNYHEVIELRGELRGRPHTSHRLEIYAAGPPYGLAANRAHAYASPNRLLGVVPNVTTDASGMALWTFTPTPSFLTIPVVATATDGEGNTSEFSPVFQEYIVNSNGDDGAADPAAGDPRVNAGTGFPVVTLRSALQASEQLQAPARVVFRFAAPTVIPVTNALPDEKIALNFDNTSNDLVTTPQFVTLAGRGAAGGTFAGLTFDPGSSGSSVRGLRLGGFGGSGLRFFGDSNVVDGCFIGSVTGETGQNLASGIELHGSFNRIGGALGNFIGGNVSNGIALLGHPALGASGRVTGNQIINNVIGLGVGNEATPNAVGVRLENADGNLIGKLAGQPPSFARNFITANPTGVLITGPGASNNVVTGTLFGEDRTGFPSLAGSLRGVHLLNAPRNRIGGASIDENFFVRASDAAIVVEGEAARANEIFGNEIGRPRLFFPTQPLNGRGIVLQDAVDTRIGRAAAEFGNFIGNCSGPALELLGQTRGTFVLGNFIGVRETGASASNHAAAAVIDVASTGLTSHQNFIGALGLGPMAANRLAHNARGIVIRRGVGQGINGNFIHDNGGPGIDLGDNGVTPNAPDPADFTSPNHFQDFPEITNLVGTANALFVMGRVRSAGGEMRLEFYNNAACDPGGFGEGETPLATMFLPTVPGVNGFQFQLPGPRSRWHFLTATATDAFFNTSEFGPCLAVPATDALDTDGDGIPDAVENGSGFTDVNGDGINDALQSHVLLTRAGAGGLLTAVTTPGLRFGNFSALPDPTRALQDATVNPLGVGSPPPGVAFPGGLIAFVVTNQSAGGAFAPAGASGGVQVRLTFETNAPINGYWVYAPTATDTNPSWQRFLTISNEPGATVVLSNALAHVGVSNYQYVVTLNLQDGPGGGDADHTVNGVIQHLGAPGLEPLAFRDFGFAPGPGFKLTIPTIPGRHYTVERSANLLDWQPLLQSNVNNVTIMMDDTNAAPRFYRTREE